MSPTVRSRYVCSVHRHQRVHNHGICLHQNRLALKTETGCIRSKIIIQFPYAKRKLTVQQREK